MNRVTDGDDIYSAGDGAARRPFLTRLGEIATICGLGFAVATFFGWDKKGPSDPLAPSAVAVPAPVQSAPASKHSTALGERMQGVTDWFMGLPEWGSAGWHWWSLGLWAMLLWSTVFVLTAVVDTVTATYNGMGKGMLLVLGVLLLYLWTFWDSLSTAGLVIVVGGSVWASWSGIRNAPLF
ncbi:hypothetical protein [Longispora albida]|uniref:hypothetical protein n=1 Tax=Longispora albida TaxID=203523 RepID=UPI000399A6B2|nr:hypothetical protein [Longispora albida]